MSELQAALKEYLTIRRRLGFELRQPGRDLAHFVAFLEGKGADVITTELALRWAKPPSGAQPATWAARLGSVRRFAAFRSATDPRTEIPPLGLLPYRYRRQPPYIYRDEEVCALVRAARALPSPKGLRAATFATILGLLAVTGLRISEALALDRDDVDLEDGVLTVRRAKFGKSRLVPVHDTTRRALVSYARRRDRVFRRPDTAAYFISERGCRATACATRYTFAKVSREIGLRASAGGHRHGHGPRLHDLRHRFAARTLLAWYRAGLDGERRLPVLSAYLGHVHVQDTYWYLEAVPELLELATQRIQDRRS